MEKKKIPNLFIIGAPKCGTTALAEYLRTHLDIFISNPKEPHFFDTDFAKNKPRIESEYLDLFNSATNTSVIGEASTNYLFSTVAVYKILNFDSKSKFIAMIRNPIDMCPSLHQQRYYEGRETEKDINKAWALQEERRKGEFKTKNKLSDPKYLQYASICSLGTQLERAMQQIPAEQLHIIVFDDFVHDTRAEYLRVLDFLQVADDGRTDFPKVNPATTVKSGLLHTLINNIPQPVYKVAFALKPLLGIKRLNIDTRVRAMNTKVEKFNDVSPETYAKMQEVFTPEIHKLEKLLNRDLSHWLNPPAKQGTHQ